MEFDLKQYKEEMIATRRHVHKHPELGFEEFETSKLVADRLESYGFEVTRGLAKTGVVGLWKGKSSGPTLALRADMDALPMEETNDVAYKSVNPGKMHACGHDGHVAILLGFAKWLSQRETPFPGNIKLIFQPAEEGHGGGELMVNQGVLKDPDVDEIYALHLWNYEQLGLIGLRSGALMASTDKFEITVKGQGGHAAVPENARDSIVAAAHIVLALQTIVSRRVSPVDPAVVSVCKIHGGTGHNIIPDTVEMGGTVRSLEPEVREALPDLIREVAQNTAKAHGAEIDFRWEASYPSTISNPDAVARVKKALTGMNLVTPKPTMGAEDMSYYLEKVPGCYILVGSANTEKGLDAAHHHPCFDFDEEALSLGLEIFVRITEAYFQENA